MPQTNLTMLSERLTAILSHFIAILVYNIGLSLKMLYNGCELHIRDFICLFFIGYARLYQFIRLLTAILSHSKPFYILPCIKVQNLIKNGLEWLLRAHRAYKHVSYNTESFVENQNVRSIVGIRTFVLENNPFRLFVKIRTNVLIVGISTFVLLSESERAFRWSESEHLF